MEKKTIFFQSERAPRGRDAPLATPRRAPAATPLSRRTAERTEASDLDNDNDTENENDIDIDYDHENIENLENAGKTIQFSLWECFYLTRGEEVVKEGGREGGREV